MVRLVESGVRFVSMVYGGWDHHQNVRGGIEKDLPQFDKGYAALIRDLDRRSMLDSTLVMVTTEFGRTPFVANPENKGREHHPSVFCSWMAGAGVKPGISYGSSDDYGINAAENEVHVHDFHATILHLLGLDHGKLMYHSNGRELRLTDGRAARVVREVVA